MPTDEYPEPDVAVPSVDPEALLDRVRRGEAVSLLDVRDRDEFEQWRVDGPGVEAVQVPYVQFVQAEVTDSVGDLAADLGLPEPVVAVCARGEASAYVAGLLREAGVDATNLAGGMDAWADLAVTREVTGYDGPGRLYQVERPSSGCLGYLLVSAGEAAAIDPLRAFAGRYPAAAADRDADLVLAVDTHVHADHLSAVRELGATTGATAVLPAGATDRGLADPDAFRLVGGGDELRVGDATLTAVHAPGHTSELVAFAVGNALLTADALFLDGVGRPDLEAGDEGAVDLAARLHETLHEVVLALPDETLVAPGHAAAGTEPADDGTFTARLGDLRERLGLLDLDREAFVDRVTSDAPPRPGNYETIVDANLGLADLADEDALELELGPNNCAVSSAAD